MLRELANTVYISESNRCLREFISAYYLYTNLDYMCTKKYPRSTLRNIFKFAEWLLREKAEAVKISKSLVEVAASNTAQ